MEPVLTTMLFGKMPQILASSGAFGEITQADVADFVVEPTISPEMALAYLALLFVVCFLLGSIPWGLIITKTFYHKDVREEGSGNIGATNVMRTVGKKGGAIAFALDFGKGVLSGFLGMMLSNNLIESGYAYGSIALCVAFLACVCGHILSPWLKFKGGKGISVAIGCLFFTYGVVGAIFLLLIFAIVVVATRYVSLGSICATIACVFLAIYLYWGNWLGMSLIIAADIIVLWAHRSNMKRLLAGTENKIGSSHIKDDAESDGVKK